MTATPSPSEQPAYRAAIVAAKDLLTLPLPTIGDVSLLGRLYATLSPCLPLSHLSVIHCEGNKALVQAQTQLLEPLPFTPCSEEGKCQIDKLSAGEGWCWSKVEHGSIHWLVARTHIKQQPLLQHLLDIAATHYSLLQASSLLDQFNSPLLNRIPFWQEKLESLTRMLRLSVNLPARQLMAQFDSTLRF